MKTHRNTHNKTDKKPYRFNLVLYGDIAEKLRKEENKNAFVAAVLRDIYEREEKEHFKNKLAQAYQESAEEDRKLAGEWDSVTRDGLL